MNHTLAAVAVGLVLSQTNPAPSTVALDSLCTGLDNSYACAQAIEAHQLSTAQITPLATRTAGGLRLRLSNGKTLSVNDTGTRDEGSEIRFSFRDHLSIGYFLLHRQAYEGADYVLIHARSGRRYPLQDVPAISPDGSRLVTASAGLSGGYAANALQIWRVRSDGIQLEFELRPQDWEPSDAAWLDGQTIRLKKQAPLLGEAREFSTTVLFKLREKWTMEPTSN